MLNHETRLAMAVAHCLHIADAMALLWLDNPGEVLLFKHCTWRGSLQAMWQMVCVHYVCDAHNAVSCIIVFWRAASFLRLVAVYAAVHWKQSAIFQHHRAAVQVRGKLREKPEACQQLRDSLAVPLSVQLS